MSEFDKLMKGGSKRKDVQNRQIKNEKKKKNDSLDISYIFYIYYCSALYRRNRFLTYFDIRFILFWKRMDGLSSRYQSFALN